MSEDAGETPRDEEARGEEGSEPEDVETWPPEDEPQGREAPPPDHEQGRQGHRDPPASAGQQPSGHRRRGVGMSDSEARNWAAGAHLASLVALVGIPSIVGPLVVWLVKRDDHAFVADQARESLNFQISVFIYTIVGIIAAIVLALATLGIGLIVILPAALLFGLGVLLLPIVAAIKASEGEEFRYPLTLRLISGRDERRRA